MLYTYVVVELSSLLNVQACSWSIFSLDLAAEITFDGHSRQTRPALLVDPRVLSVS